MTENTNSFDSNTTRGTIRAIDKDSVHKICSGQVVLTLAVAVKELLENSLDAGSTCVEIRLKEHGTEIIEVIDNGTGVKEENFEALALKHYTSKITEFSDLESVETFGFRGEALSSLCALCNVSISTRHKDANCGTKLEYDHSGKLLRRSPVAREVGTTVILQNLFCTLPVRHQEFTRNAKREFQKMVPVLYGYCLISTGVRISCFHQVGRRERVNIVSSHGLPTVKDNICSVFDLKQVKSLLEFEQHVPSEAVLGEYSLKMKQVEETNYKVEGFVSCASDAGRSCCDRQFFFINRRPCELPKVRKVINETYHTYNRNRYPAVVLNICLSLDCVDVNVTPDKRKLFVENEKVLLAVLKHSLTVMYKERPVILETKIPQGATFDISSFTRKGTSGSSLKMSPNKDLSRYRSGSEMKSSGCRTTSPLHKRIKVDVVAKCPRRLEFSRMENKSEVCEVESMDEESSVEILDVSVRNEDARMMDIVLDEPCSTNRKIVYVEYSLEKMKIALSKGREKAEESKLKYQRFKAKISPSENNTAEGELQKELRKDMFGKMEIIGQFNLGFIIAKLDYELFIIDQHASDEKYNYESLVKSTVFTKQRLVNPRDMHLSSVDETLLIENLEIFRKNGFDFEINEEEESKHRVKLSCVPLSKNVCFGKSDVEELLFMLRDSSGVMCRPSKVHEMFASRACRKSVMIGTSLNYSNMRKIVDHMGEIDNPWNCPHGRPTIRHLVNLKMLK